MTNDRHIDPSAPEPLPDALRLRLRGLRRDVPPARDLWPGISARLAAHPQATATDRAHAATPLHTTPRRHRRGMRRLGWFAAAASIALAIGIGWQLRPQAVTAPVAGRDTTLVRQADAMTREYAAAVREFESAKPAVRETWALQQLDRSAAEVRAALARDPDAVFLLEQLRRVYAQRLSLTRRLV
jgi:hypothetical protein